ncbi:MAG TPA: hypothetical protein VGQ71_14300 [Terriglobales bacterium]|jgi:hypothetical protein|nr:hypothetical protein [Terriglobales bacterium]
MAQEYFDIGYGPESNGATGTKGKIGATTRADKKRKLQELIDRFPAPPKDPAEPYNGGLGKAAKLSTDEWLSQVAAKNGKSKEVVADTGHPSWDLEITGYDWNCGMQSGYEFGLHAVDRVYEWSIKPIIAADIAEYLTRFDKPRRFEKLPSRPISFTAEETQFIKAVTPLFECHLAAYISGDRKSLRKELREALVLFRDVYRPASAVLPQDLQSPTEVKADAQPTPGKTRAWRNEKELINPEWVYDNISQHECLWHDTNHGIDGAPLKRVPIHSVMIESLIRKGVLRIEGDMPDWVREIINTPEPPPTPKAAKSTPVVDTSIIGLALLDSIRYACAHPKHKGAFNLVQGFRIEEQKNELRLLHRGMSDLNRLVGAKLASGDYGVAIQPGEVAAIVERLQVSVKAKQAARSQADSALSKAVANVVKEQEAKQNGAQARPEYSRQIDRFVATRSGGGGFIRFGGFYRSWSWVRENCNCAACGSILSRRKSTEHADGMYRDAVYFECPAVGHHVIKTERDLKWKVGAQERDERLRVEGLVKDVQEAYDWLKAKPPEDEALAEEVAF